VEQPITENFSTMEVSSLTATGVTAYTPNTTSTGAVELIVNGNKISGIIGNDEDISYYYFNAVAGTFYTIYTSGLFPDTMKTLVSLYDSDTFTTPIAEDSDTINKGSAKIIHQAVEDGTLYVTVQHGSPGTGTFDVAVRESQSTDSKDQPTEDSVEQPTDTSASSDDDGGGCFIDTLTRK
jgi:hypothetical protein